jgi:hypothetical protein
MYQVNMPRARSDLGPSAAAALALMVALSACTAEPGALRYDPPSGGTPPCPFIPEPGDWEHVGTALLPGGEGEFDRFLWGGFGGSAVRLGEEILLYYQGAEAFAAELGTIAARSIGLAVSRDGVRFAKDPASPVLEWMPTGSAEEGAASVAVAAAPDGGLVAFYGANVHETSTTINADGRWATSDDGRTFTDRGIALDHTDPTLPGYGDEVFPVIAFHHDGSWYVYYLPNERPRGQLGVAWGSAPDELTSRARVRSGGRGVHAWGMQSAVHLCDDTYALFLNRVKRKNLTVRLVDVSRPDELGEPLATYRFREESDDVPEMRQGTVLLDREAGYWYLYYRAGESTRYDVRRAPLVTR